MVKKQMQRSHGSSEVSDSESMKIIAEAFESFRNYPFKNIYSKCGYTSSGFRPEVGLNQNIEDFEFVE